MERTSQLGNPTGCAGNWLILVAGLLGLFFGDTTVSNPIDIKTEYPFVLTDEGVTYAFAETFNCNYVIAGNVEFLPDDLASHESIAIMIQQLGTYDDRPPATWFIGGDTRFGENGWSQLLVGNYWLQVWLQDSSSEMPLSEKVLVEGLDCQNDRTLAVVNFRQVLSR